MLLAVYSALFRWIVLLRRQSRLITQFDRTSKRLQMHASSLVKWSTDFRYIGPATFGGPSVWVSDPTELVPKVGGPLHRAGVAARRAIASGEWPGLVDSIEF